MRNTPLPRPTKRPSKISKKRLESLGGKVPYSSIASKTKKPRAVNTKRRSANWGRAYGSEARVEWIQRQKSVVSGKGPCVAAHVKSGGMGRKADARWIVPLTDAEHRELHRIGTKSFEAKYGASLEFHASQIEQRWQATSQGDSDT